MYEQYKLFHNTTKWLAPKTNYFNVLKLHASLQASQHVFR